MTVDVSSLRTSIAGHVAVLGDQDYDALRTVFIGGIDRKPAAIVRVANADDISRVILFAKEHKRELAVRSGGHSSIGSCVVDDGIVVDLRDLKGIEIDAANSTMWAQAGLTAREVTEALDTHNVVLGFGDTGSVGIGGITLGGGIGYLVRKFGMTIDNLLAAEIVTADGKVLMVDETNHPDLFWAIRGGGGNFGVVTRFQFRFHALGDVYGGMMMLPATAAIIAGCMDLASRAPDEFSAIFNVMPAPPMPTLAPEHHGKLAIMAIMMYAGDPKAGEVFIQPFRTLATPLADMVKPMRYKEIFFPDDPSYHPLAISKTMFMSTVDTTVAETIVDRLNASDASMRAVQLRVLGGAMSRVATDATAYAHRTKKILTNIATFYTSQDDYAKREAWVQDTVHALHQGDDGKYVGFVGNEGEKGVHAAYPDQTWKRLVAIKQQYDPTNFFHLNQNIPPHEAS